MAKRAKKAEPTSERTTRTASRGRNRGATKDTYTGRSGQLAVMAELLLLKCNVAIPEVDEGTDVFAFIHRRTEVAHLQVKTARAKAYRKGGGYSAQFSVPLKELRDPEPLPPVFYVFVARFGNDWTDFLVLPRAELANYYWNRAPGQATENFAFVVRFRRDRVLLGDLDLTHCRNAWASLPPFRDAIPVKPSPAAG